MMIPGSANSISTSNDSRVRLGAITPTADTTRYTATLRAAYQQRARRSRPALQAYATATTIALTLSAWAML